MRGLARVQRLGAVWGLLPQRQHHAFQRQRLGACTFSGQLAAITLGFSRGSEDSPVLRIPWSGFLFEGNVGNVDPDE